MRQGTKIEVISYMQKLIYTLLVFLSLAGCRSQFEVLKQTLTQSQSHDQNMLFDHDSSAQEPKTVFIVSDLDWKTALSTTSLAGFRDKSGDLIKFPFLIYHEEDSGIDIDAIIRFLEDFKPRQVVLVGNTPQSVHSVISERISDTSLILLPADQIASSWGSLNSFIFSSSDISTAMAAAHYAALKNAPLLIDDTIQRDTLLKAGAKMVCIDTAHSACAENLTIEQVKLAALQSPALDGVVLAYTGPKVSKQSEIKTLHLGSIYRLFESSFLLAPYQATVRNNVLITTKVSDTSAVKKFLDGELNHLGANRFSYLTIFANPFEIQMTRKTGKTNIQNLPEVGAIDMSVYANLDNDPYGLADLKVGRMMAFTSSDLSSLVARNQFYHQLPKGSSAFFGYDVTESRNLEGFHFNSFLSLADLPTYFSDFSNPMRPEFLLDRRIAINELHGSVDGLQRVSSKTLPLLKNTFLIEGSCLTCSFDHLIELNGSSRLSDLYCMNEIRQGALGLNTAVEINGFEFISTRLSLLSYKDAGESNRLAQNFAQGHAQYASALTGEPTAVPTDIEILVGDPYTRVDYRPMQLIPQITQKSSKDGAIEFHVIYPYFSSSKSDSNSLFGIGISEEGAVNLLPIVGQGIFIELGPLPLGISYEATSPQAVEFGDYHINRIFASQNRSDGQYVIVGMNFDFSKTHLNQSNVLPIDFVLKPISKPPMY